MLVLIALDDDGPSQSLYFLFAHPSPPFNLAKKKEHARCVFTQILDV
jgi:hypothetical protein